jgi:hypothetical protein
MHEQRSQIRKSQTLRRWGALSLLCKMKLLLILLLVFPVVGQKPKPCSANLLRADIRGFKIGDTKEKINQIFPGANWVAQTNGAEILRQAKFQDKKFDGVTVLEFRVYENILYHIGVIYDDSVKMDNIATFAADISKAWKIRDKWSGQGFVQVIECKERTVILDVLKNLSIDNTSVSAEIAKKEKAKEKPFKP